MHARCLGLKAECRIRRRVGVGVGRDDFFDLLDRCLYDVGERFQLSQGLWQRASEEDTVKTLQRQVCM